jgi:hypothetical protein
LLFLGILAATFGTQVAVPVLLALGAAALDTGSQFRNLVVMFGIVVDFLAGLRAVLAVRVGHGTERPSPGPPHGF